MGTSADYRSVMVDNTRWGRFDGLPLRYEERVHELVGDDLAHWIHEGGT